MQMVSELLLALFLFRVQFFPHERVVEFGEPCCFAARQLDTRYFIDEAIGIGIE